MIKKILKISIIFLVIGVIGMIVQKANAFYIQDNTDKIDGLK